MAAKKNAPNKSEFIRSQPSDLSASDVVAKAKAEGITIDTGLVYSVRGRAKSLGKGKDAAGGKKDPAAGSASGKHASKAEFVRGLSHLSPMEIVEQAQAAGIKLQVGYVYNIRSSNKTGAKKPAAPKPAASKAAPSVRHGGGSNEEELLKIVAAEVGLGRALEILREERARVHALLKG